MLLSLERLNIAQILWPLIFISLTSFTTITELSFPLQYNLDPQSI